MIGELKYLTYEPVDVDAWHRQTIDARDGASVEFLGIVRGEEDGQAITHLDYEAYEPMAERMIARLIAEAQRRWPIHRVAVQHRLGRVAVGEVAVLVGVQATHRDEAFAACRFVIDAIKQDAPMWKTHEHRTG
ncbi:MAG: molybdenum cofactor biosynthesis protein MoaE [Candidatus Omnitrophica bacterium]|nr:molybdenum cofactor biosynthesis protein MoaE [Candidatus Omnitrophota bacterium]